MVLNSLSRLRPPHGQQAALQPAPGPRPPTLDTRWNRGEERELLLALGVISAPIDDSRRAWIRSTEGRFRCEDGVPCLGAPHSPMAQRFIIGASDVQHRYRLHSTRPLTEEERDRRVKLEAEAGSDGDLFVVDAIDNSIVGCVDKAFAWYAAATRAFPRAKYIAKTDDDAFNHLPNIESLLRPLLHLPHVYAGWAQFASMNAGLHTRCGWAPTGGDALRRNQARDGDCHVCPQYCRDEGTKYGLPGKGGAFRTPGEGPFLFFTGCLQLMSATLTRAVFEANVTRDFVGAARRRYSDREGPYWHHWACQCEDATIGYALWTASLALGLRPTVVPLAHWMRGSGRATMSDVQPIAVETPNRRVSDFVTVHKLEVDGSALQLRLAHEEYQNRVVFVEKHVPAQHHVAALVWANRFMRPKLEDEAAAQRTRPPRRWTIRCVRLTSPRGTADSPGSRLPSGTISEVFSVGAEPPPRRGAAVPVARGQGRTDDLNAAGVDLDVLAEARDLFEGVRTAAAWTYCAAALQRDGNSTHVTRRLRR